ncbi:MAG: hypothetical protein NTAFB05_08330 [Nitrobacter sp.]|uniref:hypothetical protein n=1 Tax=Nitrobacter sp. TaxID=29420 RepID=UPI00387DFD34
MSGEAAFVEIAPFALLKGKAFGQETALRTFAADQMSGITEEKLHRIYDSFETLRERRELPRNLYPMLVTFTDINDPRTMREVNPDDLAAVFGSA